MRAECAAIATIKALVAEHGEPFIAAAFSAVLVSRVLMGARTVGSVGGPCRPCMTRRQAQAIVKAIGENLPRVHMPRLEP